MISWAREKLAESRVRWQNHRKQQRTITSSDSQSSSVAAPSSITTTSTATSATSTSTENVYRSSPTRHHDSPQTTTRRSTPTAGLGDPINRISVHSQLSVDSSGRFADAEAETPKPSRRSRRRSRDAEVGFGYGLAVAEPAGGLAVADPATHHKSDHEQPNESAFRKYCAAASKKDLRNSSPSIEENAWYLASTASIRFGRRLPAELHVPYINVKVLNCIGQRLHLCVPVTITGRDVKQKAIAEFQRANQLFAHEHKRINCDNFDLMQLTQLYKLTRICKLHENFEETATLAAISCQNNEEMMLVWCAGTAMPSSSRSSASSTTLANDAIVDFLSGYCAEDSDEASGGDPPTQQQIDAATATVEPQKFAVPSIVNIDELVLQSDVQYDIRKILISLCQLCAYVIGAGPYASRIIVMLKQKLIQRRRHEHDTQQCLIDMGFSTAKVQHALHINNNVYAAALEWLIENQSPTYTLSDEPAAMSLSSKFTNNNTIKDNIESLLEIIRIYCQRDIAPSADMIQLMIEMGFDEATARQALKASKNHQSYACEWLVGNRSKVCQVEQTDGLPPDSPILAALLDSPHVQLSLSNPKIFMAYLSILEDYTSMGMWLNDAETSGIIGQVLRTYHEEKHILAINEFSQR